MTEVEPLDRTDRALMWRVAALWVRDRPRTSSGSRFLDSALQPFEPIEETTLLQVANRTDLPLDLGPGLGWLVGRPLAKTTSLMVPVTTIQLDGDADTITRCCLRTAVLQEREDGTIGALGWRFELAETIASAQHPYQHAQPIIGWSTAGTCLIHPPIGCPQDCAGVDPTGDESVDGERSAASLRLNQSHPAFPFPTRTMTGLIAVAMVTLYGAPQVRDLIAGEPRLSRAAGAIATDFEALFG